MIVGLEECVEGVGCGLGEDVRSEGGVPGGRSVVCSKKMEPG